MLCCARSGGGIVMKIWIVAAAAAAMGVAAQASARGPGITSQFTSMSHCRLLDHGRNDEDWVSYKCPGIGGAHAWQLFHEGTRMELGFGRKEHYAGMYPAVMDKRWRLEWRLSGGKPFAVIVRVKHMEDAPGSSLIVYRLRDDGKSCVIGEADDNARARAIADAAAANYKCELEPDN